MPQDVDKRTGARTQTTAVRTPLAATTTTRTATPVPSGGGALG